MARTTREKSSSPVRGRKTAAKGRNASKSPAAAPRAKTPKREPSKTPAKAPAKSPARTPKREQSVPRSTKKKEEATPRREAVKAASTPAPAPAPAQTAVSQVSANVGPKVIPFAPAKNAAEARVDQLLAVFGALSTIGFFAHHVMYTKENEGVLQPTPLAFLGVLPGILLGVQTYRQAVHHNALAPWNYACFVLLYFIGWALQSLLTIVPSENKSVLVGVGYAVQVFAFLAAFRGEGIQKTPAGLVIATAAVVVGVQAALGQSFPALYWNEDAVQSAQNFAGLLTLAMGVARAGQAWSTSSAARWPMLASGLGFWLISPQVQPIVAFIVAHTPLASQVPVVQAAVQLVALYFFAYSV